MASIGSASLAIIPSFKGFGAAVQAGTSREMAAAGTTAGNKFGGSFKRALKLGGLATGLGAALGVTSFIKDSVQLEATFSKTMAQIGVATGAAESDLARLDDLAVKLGKDTIFSAAEASDAMLELAKNGISTATIEAGALKSALTLAAAGGVGMGEAAQVMGNALNAFQLKGKQANRVAAALAGSANASSADVGDLAQALQQTGLAANAVGFSVEETTALLAGFANAGIAGSDAGTSLKVMLDRLQPTTNKQSKAFEALGLVAEDGRNKFIDMNGEFKSAAEIAELLKKGTEGLTQAESKRVMTQAFGMDAQRAASVLAREGAEGIEKLTRATSDQRAADKMAQASMSGTAGALEELAGSWETAKLEFGKSLAPVAKEALDFLADNVDTLGPKLADAGEWIADTGVPTMKRFAGHAKDAAEFAGDLVGWLNDLPKEVKIGGLGALAALTVGAKFRSGKGALGAAARVTGLAKGTPVYVTNWAQIGAGGGAGGAVAKGGWVASAGKAFGLAAAPAIAAYLGYKVNADLNKKRTSDPRTNPGAAGSSEHRQMIAGWQGAEGGVNKYNEKLERTRDHLLTITNGVTGFASETEKARDKVLQTTNGVSVLGDKGKRAGDRASDGLREIGGAADKARERVRLLAADLDWVARPREARITITRRYADAGRQTYGGLQETTEGRTGGTTINIDKVEAKDYDDLMTQLERRRHRATLEGRR